MNADEPPTRYECLSCGNVGFGDGPIHCCEGRMEPAEPTDGVDAPALEAVLRSVFDMSRTELEICLCVMEDGDLTVRELAADIGYDRSVVSRHLNHLAELGVVEKQRRLLEAGGHTYLYTPVPPEKVRARLRGAFFTWVEEAVAELSNLEREKVESIADTGEDPAWEIYRQAKDA